MTVIHSTASAQSRVATLHLIVHELLAFLVVPSGNRDASPRTASGDRIGRGAGVPVAHRTRGLNSLLPRGCFCPGIEEH